jgi:hypothetical protein
MVAERYLTLAAHDHLHKFSCNWQFNLCEVERPLWVNIFYNSASSTTML